MRRALGIILVILLILVGGFLLYVTFKPLGRTPSRHNRTR